MEFNKKLTLNGAVITKEKMIQLMNITEKYTGKKEILDIKFKDNSGYSDLSVTEFNNLDFDNKIIENMSIYVISSYESEFNTKLTFTYYRTDFKSNIEFSSNSKDCYLNMKDDIEKWKVSVTDRKWSSFIHKWYFYLIVFFIICASLSIFIYKLFCAADADLAVKILSILIQIIFYLFTIPCVKIVKYSFPKVELDIGVNKHNKMRKILWVVISVIVIPFIISLLIK